MYIGTFTYIGTLTVNTNNQKIEQKSRHIRLIPQK